MKTTFETSNAAINWAALAGRILVGVVFLGSGLSKIGAPDATQGYIAAMGLPFPVLGFALAVLIEVGGGLLLIAGWRTRAIAGLLAVFTLATAVIFHHQFADQNQMIHFLKNLAMVGGLLQVVAFGAGRFSLDARSPRQPSIGAVGAA